MPSPAHNAPVLRGAPPLGAEAPPRPAPPPGLRPLRRPRRSAPAQCGPRRARCQRPRLSHGVGRPGQLVELGVPGRGRTLPEHPGDLSGGLQAAAHLRRQHPEVQPGPSSLRAADGRGRRRSGLRRGGQGDEGSPRWSLPLTALVSHLTAGSRPCDPAPVRVKCLRRVWWLKHLWFQVTNFLLMSGFYFNLTPKEL